MSSPESEHLVKVLRSLRQEDVPEAALAEVRGRVLDRIGSRKPAWWFAFRWRFALVPAAAALVLLVALSPRLLVPPSPRLLVPPSPSRLVSPSPPPPVPSLPAPAVAKAPSPRPRRRAAPKPAPAPQEPLLVKMFTDDPDVVIYWLIDAEGDSL